MISLRLGTMMKLTARANVSRVVAEIGKLLLSATGQTRGYQRFLRRSREVVAEITGFARDFAPPKAARRANTPGLLVIRAFHEFARRKATPHNVCSFPPGPRTIPPAPAMCSASR